MTTSENGRVFRVVRFRFDDKGRRIYDEIPSATRTDESDAHKDAKILRSLSGQHYIVREWYL